MGSLLADGGSPASAGLIRAARRRYSVARSSPSKRMRRAANSAQ